MEATKNNDTQNRQMIEMIEILKALPEAQQAYLNGVAVGMATERKLTKNQPTPVEQQAG